MLEILEAGLLTTVQDGGRWGWGRYGIPPSGPMDAAAFRAANLLVHNPPDAAALEITLSGPAIRAQAECLIAVCGAGFDLWVGNLPVPNWHAVYVRPGQLIRFGQLRDGARAYLAVSGGLALPRYLGSQSTYLKGGFGGLDGRALRPGDRLPCAQSSLGDLAQHAGKVWPRDQRPPYSSAPVLRVMLGPQEDYFSDAGLETFLSTPYKLTPAADRMGIRLQGTAIQHRGPTGIPSDGVVSGSIQVPPDGQPIVMMVDHQTTGGYPKIATLLQADLPLLAQCLPGDEVHFVISESATKHH